MIEQENAGPGAARNHGLSLARGEFAAFLDGDDYWLPNFLADALSLFSHYGPETMTAVLAYCLDSPGNSMWPTWHAHGLHEGLHRITSQTPADTVVALLHYLNPCNMLVRRDFLRAADGYYMKNHCRYGEDTYLELKLVFAGATAVGQAPAVVIDSSVSQLSVGAAGMHELDPCFIDQDDLFHYCPLPLHDLLRQVLALLAMDTAEEFVAWGLLREGRALLHAFSHPCLRWTPRRWRCLLLTLPLVNRWRRLRHRLPTSETRPHV